MAIIGNIMVHRKGWRESVSVWLFKCECVRESEKVKSCEKSHQRPLAIVH